MFLREIRIRNLRSIPALDLSFEDAEVEHKGRRWTLLLGENGVGKSTVLKAIGLITAGSEAIGQLFGDADAWVRNGEQSAEIYARIETAEGKSRELSLTIKRGTNIRSLYAENADTLDELDRAIERARRNYFVLGYGVSRRLPAATGSWSREGSKDARFANVASLFNADVPLTPLEAWAMDLDYRHADALDVVRAAIERLLPGVNFSHIDKAKRRLIFDTPDGEVPLAFLSDGYQNMAAWCGDLLYRITETFEDYKDPLAARGLLLIDELDLHLHPQWQRRLVDFLTQTLPNMQIVATTHSALTVHQARENELYVLRRPQASMPPQLIPFEGDPSKLSIQQLIVSPLFGLETSDSLPVEALRQQARDLQFREKEIGDTERTQLNHIAQQLRELPDAGRQPEYLREQAQLLERIQAELMDRKVSK
ncbi:AAA family ATPase [Usitatibacter palustris]|uniref:AAA+ ATPase domain-containing protein n=1 Tax=Usitatibacter palustris TaxID=2732487 RepID=A0A6M4H9P4_9PROT|nr:AAA family ATPase [Usitatibacter palustris]QJR15905.1 hypothetical protein DSM104440_02731 [Usitatibacter palustris]